CSYFFLYASGDSRVLPSFPTRRSSDLVDLVFRGRGAARNGKSYCACLVLDALAGEFPTPGGFIDTGAETRGLRMRHDRERGDRRSEEHTSELQSRENLVCRLLLEKKNT